MDSVCFIAMISMFAKVGTKDSLIKAEELFEKYLEKKSGIGIDETTFGVYGAMLEVYSKYGDIRKMERIWKEMTSGFVVFLFVFWKLATVRVGQVSLFTFSRLLLSSVWRFHREPTVHTQHHKSAPRSAFVATVTAKGRV